MRKCRCMQGTSSRVPRGPAPSRRKMSSYSAGHKRAREAEVVDVQLQRRCGLCLGDEERAPLWRACACLGRGSAKFVHADCLERWRAMGNAAEAQARCGQCYDEYRSTMSVDLLRVRLLG